ncbi:13037_t:CDS:1, partial [Cetraspora pellucida]
VYCIRKRRLQLCTFLKHQKSLSGERRKLSWNTLIELEHPYKVGTPL